MSIAKTIEVLSAYSKYRNGRGKKYAEPDTPFCNSDINDAIKHAVKILKAVEKFTLFVNVFVNGGCL